MPDVNVCVCGEYPESGGEYVCIFRGCADENACRVPVGHGDDHGANHHVNAHDYASISHGCVRVNALLSGLATPPQS